MAKTKSLAPNRRMVLRALHDLQFNQPGVRVTADQVAQYLKVEVEAIAPFLKELKRRRMVRTAKRQGLTVWMPWKGQRG